MAGSIKLTELPAGSIRIATHRRKVRIDEATEETEQCYLTVEGSPDGFRWLSQHFNSLAVSASKGGNAATSLLHGISKTTQLNWTAGIR